MNRKLKKQIKVYAGVTGAILIADKLNGQIVYVNINLDTTVSGDLCHPYLARYDLDIDNDSIIDFRFKAVRQVLCAGASTISMEIKVNPWHQNKINNALYHSGWFSPSMMVLNAMKLNQGDTINANGAWLSSEKYLHRLNSDTSASTDLWSGGAWNPGSDNYLPFLLFKNSNNYYGWIHIQIINNFTFTMKEYAYNTIPNAPIIAGDTLNSTLSLPELNSVFQIFQDNNFIHIVAQQHSMHANISVYDLLGKEILQQPFEGKETKITVEKKGIYFIEVKSEKGIFRKKVFVY